jgi:hypothetical protein
MAATSQLCRDRAPGAAIDGNEIMCEDAPAYGDAGFDTFCTIEFLRPGVNRTI